MAWLARGMRPFPEPAVSVIGILGGTFDPIHHGHLRPALEIYERLGLDELRLVPAHVPPHRPLPGTTAEHRLAMAQRAICGLPGFRVDRRELDRGGPSFSVDTLLELRAEVGPMRPLLMLMGLDAFAGLHTWHRWREIPGLAHVVVVTRPGSALPASGTGYLEKAEIVASSEQLRDLPCGDVLFQEVTSLDISATAIRALVRSGRSPKFLLPDPVLDYILENDLYRNDREEILLIETEETRHAK
jgi:nicotinate-nucleotide adenylyltransferase